MNYYIFILEEKIKSFSLVGHGERCAVAMTLKGFPNPLDGIVEGDKVVGFVSGNIRRFSYLFNAGFDEKSNQFYFEKTLEIKSGAGLDSVSPEIKEIVEAKEQTESFVQIDKGIYSQIMDAMLVSIEKMDEFSSKESEGKIEEKNRVSDGTNILLYGVPGSGKSWTIAKEYCEDEDKMERLVFHPDYMYSDFVGQILPVVKGSKVEYEFVPGPFTKILKKAYHNPSEMYYLIIEEINRGNAPAIFGDIFQLLDRMTDEGKAFKIGTSEYPISNENIAKEVYGSKDMKVRIPSNLSIIGTMNTSDQNVFTLDNAFQRRWHMRLIPNSFEDHPYAEKGILDTTVSWKSFCDVINAEILRRDSVASSEDKRLGAYFVALSDLIWHEEEDQITDKESDEYIKAKHKNAHFAEKVLKYLWDDAFKFNHSDVFVMTKDGKDVNSLEVLIDFFSSVRKNRRFDIFEDTIKEALLEAPVAKNVIVDSVQETSDRAEFMSGYMDQEDGDL